MRSALFIAMFLFSGAALARPVVKVRRKASVPTTRITLGHVATLSGFSDDARARIAAIEIGPAPRVGLSQLLPRAYLEGRLRDGDLPANVRVVLPKRLEVKRATQKISGTRLQQDVKDAVRAALPFSADDVAEIRVPRVRDIEVPRGAEVVIEVRDDQDFRGRALAEIRVMDSARRVHQQRLNVKLEVFETACVLSREVKRGDVLQAGDLKQARRPQSQVPRDALRDIDLAVGAKARQSISAGEPLRAAWVELPRLVDRRDRVRIVARSENFELVAQGEALGSGRKGDMVQVRNIGSRKIVVARVTGPKTVEVEL